MGTMIITPEREAKRVIANTAAQAAAAAKKSGAATIADRYKAGIRVTQTEPMRQVRETVATARQERDQFRASVPELHDWKKKEDEKRAAREEAAKRINSAKEQKTAAEKNLADADERLNQFYSDHPYGNAGTDGQPYKPLDETQTAERVQLVNDRKNMQKALENAGEELAGLERKNAYDRDLEEIDALPDDMKKNLESMMNMDSIGFSPAGMAPKQAEAWMQEKGDAYQALRDYGYSYERINQLAKSYSTMKNAQASEKMKEEAAELQDHNGQNVAANLGSILLNGAAGLTGTFETLNARARGASREKDDPYNYIDPNAPGFVAGQLASNVRGETAQTIAGDEYDENGNLVKDGGKVRQALSYAYQGGMSLADSLFRAMAGGGSGGGAMLAAANSFSQTVADATRQGATQEEATRLGIAVAGIEYLSEKIPMDKMFETAKSGNKNVFKEALEQAGIEATTEEISLISSKVAEAAILQDKSSYKQQIGDLVASGMSYEDAKKQADKAFWKEFKETGIISGMSGGFSGGGAAVVGNYIGDRMDAAPEAPGTTLPANAQNPAQAPAPDFGGGTAARQAQGTAADILAAPENQQAQNAAVDPMAHLLDGVVDQTPAPAPLTPAQEQLNQAYNETMGVAPEGQQNTAVPDGTTVTVKSANTAITEENKAKNTLAYKLATNLDSIQGMQPVSKLTGLEFKKQDGVSLPDQIRGFFKSLGNKVSRNGFGDISLNEYGVGGMMNHRPLNRAKLVSLAAVPDVIRNGKQIDFVPNWKGRGYETYIFAAPVTVSGSEVYVAAVVNKKPDSKFYLSEMVDSNGNYVRIEESPSGSSKYDATDGAVNPGRADAPLGPEGLSEESIPSTMSAEPTSPPTNTIPQSDTEVNGNSPDIMSMSEEDFLDSMGSNNGGAEANPFADRSWYEVGKRSEKAFMHQNPEVKKLFQSEAAMLYGELGDTIKGERTFNEEAYYQSGGESGWSGTKRHASEGIVDLLDNGFTYDQIEKGLLSIMEDHGAENNAVAKRIEFIINDRLLNGYTSFYDGSRVPPNAEYVEFANSWSAPDVDTQVPSTEGGQQGAKPAMGAADAGFTAKPAYNATLSEQNRQADRRDDVRPMELPKTDVKGNPVSAVTGNAYGSKVMPDDFASLMEEPVARGDFSYMKITNDKATQMAAETIGRSGTWEEAYRQFARDVDRGVAGAEISARGALLLNRAAQTGDANQRLSILSDMQRLGTNTAQGLQAMRLIRSLNPPDKIEFIEMTVRRMASDLKLADGLEVDPKLIAEYDKAKTDADRDAVIGRIQENVASQIPSTFMDKFNALRYTNMLGNLKTNVRNVAGNVGSNVMYKIKDAIAANVEALTYRITGAERTKKVFVTDRKLLKACKEDFEHVSGIVGDGGKYGDQTSAYGEFQQGVMDKRRIFKNPLMEGYRKATNWAMNNKYFGDEAFGKAAYSRALAGYLEINGMSAKEFRRVVETGKGNTALVDRARAYAVQQAQEMTFHDNTALARIMSRLQKDMGVVGQGIMPFTKTPANVLVRSEEFSPLGIINSTVKTIKKAKGDVSITGADLIDSWSKSMTGTAIFTLGAAMMNAGLLTGGPDDDEEKAEFDRMNGVQNYAVRDEDGLSYTFDWLTPAAMPLFMGAEMMKAVDKEGEMTFADLENVFTSIADPMIQMSMMQGINDSLDNIKYSKNNIGQFFVNAAVNYLLQGVSNTALGQLEKSTEKNRVTTHVDKDSNVPQWMQRQLGKLSQKIPGWDYQQTEYLDAWGKEQENEGGSAVGRTAYNLLSPGYLSKEEESELNDELYRLRESTGENVFPQPAGKTVTYKDTEGTEHRDYNLSSEEFAAMQKEQGQTAQRLLSEIIGSKDYNALTDPQRAAVVSDVYQYAREQGRKAALPDYHSEADAWIRNMGNDAASTIIQRAALGEVNAAVSAAADSLKNGWDVTEAGRQELDTFYDSFKGMGKEAQAKILEDAVSDTARYLEMREKGLTTGEYISVVSRVKALGSSGVKDIQIYEAIADDRTLSEKDKDAAIMAYMDDYDPTDKSPDTTELKYQYARQEIGMKPEEYLKALRVSAAKKMDENTGEEKGLSKYEKIAKWQEMGYTWQEANVLYRLLCATGKAKIDVKSWYNGQ